MSISERIKELRRDYLHMNQADFAAPLGLRQSTVGNYESGSRSISDASILAICREYGVSEQWLRDGVGEVFVSGSVAPSIISDLAQEYDLDFFDQAIIGEYLKLDKPTRAALKKKLKEFLKAVEDAESDSIEKEVDAYREELKAEKRETSSASDIGNAKEA
jgi:transcriptional regulator with XRE-family HTH domain